MIVVLRLSLSLSLSLGHDFCSFDLFFFLVPFLLFIFCPSTDAPLGLWQHDLDSLGHNCVCVRVCVLAKAVAFYWSLTRFNYDQFRCWSRDFSLFVSSKFSIFSYQVMFFGFIWFNLLSSVVFLSSPSPHPFFLFLCIDRNCFLLNLWFSPFLVTLIKFF